MTIGAYQGIFWLFQAFVEEGDEVIVFNPTFDAYRVTNAMTRGTIVPVSLKIEVNWLRFGQIIKITILNYNIELFSSQKAGCWIKISLLKVSQRKPRWLY